MPEAERDFLAALTPNDRALLAYERLAPSHRLEFLAYVLEGPARDRALRIGAAVEILSEAV